ncbi:class I SAM-dependent methyltransferase [Candidatus Babeliales bacterium]|nr:class I SAM-dependent methyltransferase [Candidatus Babeliales bacterium]
MKFLNFDTTKSWDYENGFYLTSDIRRISKLLAHYELYKKIVHLPGQVIEFGVYKGNSLIRFLTFREILESPYSRKVIGFDIFGQFPKSQHLETDRNFVKNFEAAGGDGISDDTLKKVLLHKEFKNFELIKGDILETLPRYLKKHPELKISLLHIDVDVYEPTKIILEQCYDKLVPGGMIVFDDYGTVHGETKAIDEFFMNKNIKIEKNPIAHIPSFICKNISL